jgi:RNAse (barnase) inhibitor barstar
MTLAAKLKDVSLAGSYLAPREPGELLGAVRKSGLKLIRVDLGGVRDKARLLDAIANGFEFPDWFGGNWDALEDCLTDLSWKRARGYVVILENSAEFIRCKPDEFATAREVFDSAAEYWAEQGKPFWTLFGGVDAPVPGIGPLD